MGNIIDEEAKPFAVADAAFRRCTHASEFIATTVIPEILPHVEADTAGKVLFAQLVRIDYWLRSLRKLDSPTDYQGMSAGCRALLECAVDIALVRANRENFQTVLDWEDSAKLKHAQALATYTEKDKEIKARFERPIRWAERERDRIASLRRKHRWVEQRNRPDCAVEEKPIHPSRWTNRDLGTDARQADKAQQQWNAEGPRFHFERYYETRYRELCWDTHGSGNIHRLIHPDNLPTIGAKAFYDCARMAMAAASWVVRYFDLWDADMEAKFHEAASMLHGLYIATLQAYGLKMPAVDSDDQTD